MINPDLGRLDAALVAPLWRPTRAASARPARSGTFGIRSVGIAGGGATATLAVVTAGVPLGPSAAVVVGIVAMGGLVLAWLALGRHLATVTSRQLCALLAVWGLPLLVARPLFSGDVWSYLAQGMTAAIGLDPYHLGPAEALGTNSPLTQHVSHYWVDTPAPYGPAWLAMSRAVAVVTGQHLTIGVLAYRLIAVFGVAAIAWALPRLARRVGARPTTTVWLGVLNPLVLWHLVAGAHNDALMLGLALAGMELALAGLDRTGAAGRTELVAGVTLLTIAANIKIVAAVGLCCLAIEVARRRRSARTVMALLLGAVAGTLVLSTISGFGWIAALRTPADVYSWMAPTTALGLVVGAITTHPAAPVTAANLIGAAICLPAVVRPLVATWRGRLHPLRAVGLVFVAVLLCGPVVHPWYVLWAVLPLAASARTRSCRTAVAGVSAAVAVALPPVGADAAGLLRGYLIGGGVLGAALLLRGIARMPSRTACPRSGIAAVPARRSVLAHRRGRCLCAIGHHGRTLASSRRPHTCAGGLPRRRPRWAGAVTPMTRRGRTSSVAASASVIEC